MTRTRKATAEPRQWDDHKGRGLWIVTIHDKGVAIDASDPGSGTIATIHQVSRRAFQTREDAADLVATVQSLIDKGRSTRSIRGLFTKHANNTTTAHMSGLVERTTYTTTI